MKKLTTSFLLLLLIFPLVADDGMWLPLLLNKTRYDRMVELGCKLTPEDIYSVNNASLKDAVVLFDRGCSGVVVSDKGLLLTNHHCGYGAIQNHSSLDHDYLTNGFIANAREEELPNPSLTVSFLVKMEDVTESVLSGISANISEMTRRSGIQKNIELLIANASKNSTHKFVVKPLYNDNQFFIYEYEVFTDVRLVAAPPSSIGKFGGDTDNWVWPRHTGDFSIFRIYADKNNNPAPYSADNVPYKPKKFVPVSIKGVAENDFTMVYGFPAATEQYLASQEVELMLTMQLPQKVALRTIRLNIMQDEMDNNPLTRIQYAAKYAGTSNAWKKWQGMIKGLSKTDAVSKKKQYEQNFQNWVQQNSERSKSYGSLLSDFEKNYEVYKKYALVVDYNGETVLASEIILQASRLFTFLNKNGSADNVALKAELQKYSKGLAGFYKNYSSSIDKKTFIELMKQYKANISPEFYPTIFQKVDSKFKGDYSKWADFIFSKSVLVSPEKFNNIIASWNKNSLKKLYSDPALETYISFYEVLAAKVADTYNNSLVKIDSLYRIYMRGLVEYNKDKILFPDANQTLRISYGQVKGYSPADAVDYEYYTTLDGMFEKEDSAISDYKIAPKLAQVYKDKDFGRYADSAGEMRVCFVATNHSSGGNSGSPVFNARGELIGLNFDRCWEGTMSDIFYDPSLCRNITLDIRYLLFVLEKVSGAKNLVDEMTIVQE